MYNLRRHWRKLVRDFVDNWGGISPLSFIKSAAARNGFSIVKYPYGVGHGGNAYGDMFSIYHQGEWVGSARDLRDLHRWVKAAS